MTSSSTDAAPGTRSETQVVNRQQTLDVLHDVVHFAACPPPGSPLDQGVLSDPLHERWRALLEPPLSPPQTVNLGLEVVRIANELLHTLLYRDTVDFVSAFSRPYASRVMALVLGLPEDAAPRLLHAALTIGHAASAAEATRAAAEVRLWLAEELAARDGAPVPGLLDVLAAQLPLEVAEEIALLLIMSGVEPLAAALESIFAHLADRPDLRAQLAHGPNPIRDVVEELLRWESPVAVVDRVATAGAQLAGCPVATGQRVTVALAAANRDASWIADAASVHPDRAVNPHAAFGVGPHRCLGSHLARMSLRVALRYWHEQIPDYHLAPGAVLQFGARVRALDSLPLILGHRR